MNSYSSSARNTLLLLLLSSLVVALVGVQSSVVVTAFSLPNQQQHHHRQPQPQQHRGVGRTLAGRTTTISAAALNPWQNRNEDGDVEVPEQTRRKTFLVAAVVVATGLGLGGITPAAYADEYGREREAPTLFTGETVEICVKRGPLGACTKTELRTTENENDKSEKYFKQPTELVKRKDEEARQADDEGNELIARLKQQSEDNREKNDLLVKQRTMVNDASASFGPFDQQVLILNEDGKGFTLLANPQAMRLKKAGLIGDDKKFTRQPTQEELDAALESGPGLFDRFFGGGDE
eukprot:CAMPEP_0113493448 /NCGR_PEP_ID=MMETSP0014_2-20120614/28597_1 /TAXON_ID=2857 /ORGANISM="Nitzschia sp." /LENGTH=292 /DNA_ID=CAMNT_0000387311 /DNA_START=56 /DNA_END=934 /DNA_ORIENTATION=- /assembly_acc=CAM_ASM_000159